MNALIYPVGSSAAERVASLLTGRPGIAGVYRVGDVAKGRRLAALCHPGLLVMDAAQGDDAIDFARDVRTCNPLAQVLVLCGNDPSPELAGLLLLPDVHHFDAVSAAPERLAEALDVLLSGGPTVRPPLYSARLERVALLDLLKIKAFSGDTTVLGIVGGQGESGEVIFERGALVHARAGRNVGRGALAEILSWAGGSLQEMPVGEDPPHTITDDTGVLLLNLARDGSEMPEAAPIRELTMPEEETRRHQIGERTVHIGDTAEDELDLLETLPKILVIDDNPMILRYTDEVLARHWSDHAIIAVQNVAEGESCMSEYRPRMVLLDHHLPDGSGADLAARWLLDPDLADIPVVMISGYTEHLVEAARRCPNIVATLAKPFTPGQLIEAVRGAESFIRS